MVGKEYPDNIIIGILTRLISPFRFQSWQCGRNKNRDTRKCDIPGDEEQQEARDASLYGNIEYKPGEKKRSPASTKFMAILTVISAIRKFDRFMGVAPSCAGVFSIVFQ